MIDTFFADVTAARSAYNARKTDSPIIAWITDPAWAPVLVKDTVTKRWKLPTRFRGLPGFYGSAWRANGATSYYQGMIATGEISVLQHTIQEANANFAEVTYQATK
ncbi:MAG TPA: hypothetical protein VIY48_04105 [Candidatus Paceibacterota bacterium]